jgi:glucose-1-phosphate thymidylyltransferase
VGLIPAAGRASRIGPLPCSKEIYPVGFDRGGRPQAVVRFLLEALAAAGVTTAYVLLRSGKWDIPGHLAAADPSGVHLAYLVMAESPDVPFTLDRAYPFVRGKRVALGFPDIHLGAADPFSALIERLDRGRCDIVLGLFPCDRPQQADMVALDHRGRVRDIVPKPQRTTLRLSWGVAAWNPVFTEFLHAAAARPQASGRRGRELFIGEVVRAALRAGLRAEAVKVSGRPFRDIGTPEGLVQTARRLMPPPRRRPAGAAGRGPGRRPGGRASA